MELRMLKVLPEKVAKHWGVLRWLIDKVLPPVANPDERLNCILEHLLIGRAELFQFIELRESEAPKPLAFTILVPLSILDGDRCLLIYAINSYKTVGRAAIMEGWNLISRYAKSLGCNAVVAYSSSESVIKLMETFGADVSQRFIRMEV